MKPAGVWRTDPDGTINVCAVCDSVSETRRELEAMGREWRCAPCPAHAEHQNKIQQWLEKQKQRGLS